VRVFVIREYWRRAPVTEGVYVAGVLLKILNRQTAYYRSSWPSNRSGRLLLRTKERPDLSHLAVLP
jgi:hypothetical protein